MRTELLNRRKEHRRIQQSLERFHSPRFQMALIVSLTGAIGFFASVALLHARIDSMWLRYPLAVGFAYGAFLFLLWRWVRLRGTDVIGSIDLPSWPSRSSNAINASPHDALAPGGGGFGGGGASGTFGGSPISADSSMGSVDVSPSVSDAVGGVDLGEFTVVVIAIAAMLGAAWVALGIVTEAPSLFAELMLDAALAGGLYRRLRGVAGDHWLRTAVRRTAWRFAVVAMLISIAGWAMHVYAPEAKSIGHVFVPHG